jgi:flagellar biosynthesis/type III secretory pathway protein FliH
VTHPLEQSAIEKPGFSPWSPKQLNQSSTQNQPAPVVQLVADDVGSEISANSVSPEQSSAATQHLEPVAIPPNSRITTDAELELLRSAAFDAGKRQALDELGQQTVDNELGFRELINSLSASKVDMSGLQKSVTELSMFIASQIVRAELSINAQWCENLIERCLAEIRLHGNDVVAVRLSRSDFESHCARLVQAHEAVHFTHDDRLRPGDVEIEMGATRISELIETKLATISQQLLSSLTADTPSRAHATGSNLLLTGGS